MKLTKDILCRMIDHTNLKPYATREDLKKLCEEAVQYHFAMVAVNSSTVKTCHEFLKETDIHVGAAISFPLGQTTIEAKEFETENAIRNGADEIDYVINIGKLKEKDYAYIEDEMFRIVDICRRYNRIVKVIFENCYLEKEEIQKLAQIAKKVKPDYIKTSTGFGTGGATSEDVLLMKSMVGDTVKIKAAGGIRTLEECEEMIRAGAERIGTSNGVNIIDSMNG